MGSRGWQISLLILAPLFACVPQRIGPDDEPEDAPSDTSNEADGDEGEGTTELTVDEPASCDKDSDCRLYEDCYACSAYVAGSGAAGGGGSTLDVGSTCDETQCDVWGISEVECRFGQCEFKKQDCSAEDVSCDAEAPECSEPAFVPGVDEEGSCWTGKCVPATLCLVVPDCGYCNPHAVCVSDEFGALTCERKPEICEVAADMCGCAPQLCGDLSCSNTEDGIACL